MDLTAVSGDLGFTSSYSPLSAGASAEVQTSVLIGTRRSMTSVASATGSVKLNALVSLVAA